MARRRWGRECVSLWWSSAVWWHVWTAAKWVSCTFHASGIPFHVARIKITNRVQLCTDLLLAIIISYSCGHRGGIDFLCSSHAGWMRAKRLFAVTSSENHPGQGYTGHDVNWYAHDTEFPHQIYNTCNDDDGDIQRFPFSADHKLN